MPGLGRSAEKTLPGVAFALSLLLLVVVGLVGNGLGRMGALLAARVEYDVLFVPLVLLKSLVAETERAAADPRFTSPGIYFFTALKCTYDCLES